jgi:hypothetical protein
LATLIFEDSIEESPESLPWSTTTNYNIFTTNAAGSKLIIPSNMTLTTRGVRALIVKVGTPAGDLRCRIMDSSDAVVSGTTRTVDKDSLLTGTSSNRSVNFIFDVPVALAAGTYRVVLDSASSANSSNCWRFQSGAAHVSGLVPSGHISTSTVDVTAGPPITWTDTNTDEPPIALLMDTKSASAGGGSGPNSSGNFFPGGNVNF